MHLSDLPHELEKLEEAARLREPDDSMTRGRLQAGFGEDFIDAASNDYLGLAGSWADPVSRATDVQPGDVSRETDVQGNFNKHLENEGAPPSGAGASRLIFGTDPEHLLLEKTVAEWVRLPASLLFTSGYAANIGALGALLSPGDAVFSDALNHASLIDGIRLSKAVPSILPHLDLGALEDGLKAASDAPARWVILEAYYSMDGDAPDLGEVRRLCDQYDSHLYVDEAHSLGTFGPLGAGLCAHSEVKPDVLIAAFGKAVGAQGACVAGSTHLRTWLWNRARSFVFSTALSPVLARTIRDQIARVQQAGEARRLLHDKVDKVRSQLVASGVPLLEASFGPVVGLVAGSESRALELADSLRQEGILAQAIRPPTVPTGKSRVRLALRASLSEAQIERLVQVVARETVHWRES